MRASAYNNPLFASGLAGLVEGFVGNPQTEARSQLLAAQALNENLTAQYRQAMDVGLEAASHPLSQMMIRALQAGSQYSGNAPKISAAVNQQEAGILGLPRAGGSGGGGSAGGSTLTVTADVPTTGPSRAEVIAQARAAIAKGANPDKVILRVKRFGIKGEEVLN